MATDPPLPSIWELMKDPSPQRAGRGSPFLLSVWRCLNLVHPYQVIMYFSVFMWGVYGAFSTTASLITYTLPAGAYTIWISTHIVAPLIVWTGQILHNWKPTPKKVLLGWELQWAGDAAICFSIAAMALAFWAGPEPRHLYLVALFASLAMCAFGLATRDVIAVGYYWGFCHSKECNNNVDD